MTEPMITRAELKGLDMAARWMLTSGQPGESVGPRTTIESGIQLYVTDESGRTVARIPLDVHDAGELYQGLEAHMENVAAHDVQPMSLEERRRALRQDKTRQRNLRAIQEEIDGNGPEEPTELRPVRVPSGDQGLIITPDTVEALKGLLNIWESVPIFAKEELAARQPGLTHALAKLAVLLK